jgi:hypothetical protein
VRIDLCTVVKYMHALAGNASARGIVPWFCMTQKTSARAICYKSEKISRVGGCSGELSISKVICPYNYYTCDWPNAALRSARGVGIRREHTRRAQSHFKAGCRRRRVAAVTDR